MKKKKTVEISQPLKQSLRKFTTQKHGHKNNNETVIKCLHSRRTLHASNIFKN